MWVAAIIKDGVFTRTQVGWLASGELLSVAIGTVTISIAGSRASPRRTLASAALLVAVANAIAMLPSAYALTTGRLLSGLGTGVVLACVIGVAAGRNNAPRVLAIMQVPAMLSGSIIYFTSAFLVAQLGPSGIFAILLALASLEAVLARFGAPGSSAVSAQVTSGLFVSWPAALLACLAIANVNAAFTAIWTYIVVIGASLGFSAATIGNVLAVAAPVGMAAPVAASILGERAGLLWPITCSLLVMASVVFLLVRAPSQVLLGVYAAVFIMGASFYVPYAITLLARVDRSGRLPRAAPMVFMIGGAVGPALGSRFIGRFSFEVLPVVATSIIAVGLVFFVCAAALAPRSFARSRHHR